MSQDEILDYWAKLINDECTKDENFSLSEFLKKHHLCIEMLLIKPNWDMCFALIYCKDFDINKLINNLYIKMYRWTMLQVGLINHNCTCQLLKNRITELFKNVDCETLTNDEIGFSVYEEYPITKLVDKIITYCDNNGTSIPTDLIEIVLRTLIRNLKLLDSKQISILIRYTFKYQILEDETFEQLINNGAEKLLLYAIKLYQKRSIKFDTTCILFKDEYCKLVWTLHQNITITNLNDVVREDSLNTIINKMSLLYVALWMDEKQRFTNVKDTSLLHFRPMLVRINEFLF